MYERESSVSEIKISSEKTDFKESLSLTCRCDGRFRGAQHKQPFHLPRHCAILCRSNIQQLQQHPLISQVQRHGRVEVHLNPVGHHGDVAALRGLLDLRDCRDRNHDLAQSAGHYGKVNHGGGLCVQPNGVVNGARDALGVVRLGRPERSDFDEVIVRGAVEAEENLHFVLIVVEESTAKAHLELVGITSANSISKQLKNTYKKYKKYKTYMIMIYIIYI